MEKKRCLVLLPIGVTLRQESPAFLALYTHILLPALQAIDVPLDILRSDDLMRSGMSIAAGRLWLQEPHLVVADLTTGHSGVIHDLTLRDFLADRTVLLSQQAEDMPPCFAAYRQIIYSLSETGIIDFRRQLQHHAREILRHGPSCPTGKDVLVPRHPLASTPFPGTT
ncbi:hypothetical protein NKDENANG_03148 [Candidatus Entotheonellaceae bacterium PAL068K]